MKLVVLGSVCGLALAGLGCSDGPGVPTSPTAIAAAPGPAAAPPGIVNAAVPPSSPRSGELHVTKECSGYTGGPGSFCRITASNARAIEVDSTILYLQPELLGSPSGSDVVLDVPGPGNNKAFGHCSLAVGVCTFSGGTGKFRGFQASVAVTANDDFSEWYWNASYSFRPFE